jgi:hypothetical protein
MAKFAELVRAQRESGKGVIGSLSGAYNQQNMEKFDVRNKLFSRSGLATSLFPGLKGYKAQPISNKAPGSMVSPALNNSPTALSSIAKDAKISARNSMALPSIARNMAKIVKIWGGTPSKYFDSAAEKETAKEAKFGGIGKGGGVLGKGKAGGGGGGIMGMLGGALGGVGSMLGGALGSIGSVAGSILGGIGSLLGGAASGIFGILTSALGGMGFMGILAAGAIGFVLYQIYKSLDFSKLGSGLGDAFSGIKESLSKLFGDANNATGGRLGNFVDDVKDAFMKVTIRVSAAIETATELLMKLGGAVLKDFGGYFKNFFEENKGKIYALMAIGIMGPRALLTLPGAAITAIAAAVGAATSEKSTQQLKEELFNTETDILKNKEKLRLYKEKNPNAKGRTEGGTDYELTQLQQRDRVLTENRDSIAKQIDEKEGSTNNANKALQELSAENISSLYDTKVQEKMAAAGTGTGTSTSPMPAGSSGAGNTTFKSLSKEQQDRVLDMQFKKEGNKKGQLAFDLNNPGAMIYGEFAKKFGAVPNYDRGTLKDAKGEKVPFAQFPTFAQGREAQRALWLEKYGNTPLDQALDKWVAPRNDKEKMELANYKSGIYASLGMSAPQIENKVASADNKPTAAPSAPVTPSGGSSLSGGSTLIAGLAEPLQQLDKFLGGKLGLNSVNVADLLRDLSNESKENPMFIDNSNKNINNGGMQETSTTANAWDPSILAAILNTKVG